MQPRHLGLRGIQKNLWALLTCTLIACGQGSRGTPTATSSVKDVDTAHQAIASCDLRTSDVWLASSEFKTANSWFDTASRDRVWVTDVNNDGYSDVVGIAFDGSVIVATSTGTGFNAPTTWVTSVFNTNDGWFTNTYRQRVWVVDVTGDRRADLVGIDDAGTIYFYRNTGTGFSRQHEARDRTRAASAETSSPKRENMRSTKMDSNSSSAAYSHSSVRQLKSISSTRWA